MYFHEFPILPNSGGMKTQALQWQETAGPFVNLHISALEFGLV